MSHLLRRAFFIYPIVAAIPVWPPSPFSLYQRGQQEGWVSMPTLQKMFVWSKTSLVQKIQCTIWLTTDIFINYAWYSPTTKAICFWLKSLDDFDWGQLCLVKCTFIPIMKCCSVKLWQLCNAALFNFPITMNVYTNTVNHNILLRINMTMIKVWISDQGPKCFFHWWQIFMT